MSVLLHLASGSAVRAQLLRQAGFDFTSGAAPFDEASVKGEELTAGKAPKDIALSLAEGKAKSARSNARYTLGCDQVLHHNGRILSKAETRDDAAAVLASLQGDQHELISAAVILRDGCLVWTCARSVHLSMVPLSHADIEDYLSKAWPVVSDAVGCYHLEGLGVRLFSRIEGDYFTVLGLPLLEILSFLRAEGAISP